MLDRLIVLDSTGAVSASGPIGEVLDRESRMLVAHGIWVPGLAAPAPVTIAAGLLGPANGTPAPGSVVLRATDVDFIRSPQSGLFAAGASSATPIPALLQVNAELRAGEIVAVVGASGAGKSTLTALLAGLTLPTSGTVTLADADADADADTDADADADTDAASQHPSRQLGRLPSLLLAARFGWVPQRAELAIVARTVRDDVLSTSLRLRLDPETSAIRAHALIQTLGLSALEDADPHTLSGGELRRLAMAGALAHGPTVLVLDEPTVGQDRATWAAVVGLIVGARDAGVAVVVATHDPLLIALADRRIELVAGRVVDAGQTDGSDAGPNGAAAQIDGTAKLDITAQPNTSTPDAASAQANRRRALAARCGPLSLLGVGLLLLVGSLAVKTPTVAGLSVLAEMIVLPFLLGWRGVAVRRLLPGLLAVASIGFSTWLLGDTNDPRVAVVAGLRVAFFVLPGVLLASLVEPSALGDHLAQRLRFPARPVIAAVAALQRFDGLGQQWQELRGIRRVRGISGGRSPAARAREFAALTFALLVQSLRQASRMAVAMDARGFSTPRAVGVSRTWAERAPWCRSDTTLALVGVTLAALPLVLSLITIG